MKKKLFNNKSSFKGFLLLIAFVLISSSAMASHFRHGTISWRVVSGNTVEFKISQAWANFGNWSVGQTGYGDRLYFGDGQSQNFAVAITAVNSAENWYYGETTIRHTYSNAGNFIAYYTGCCKISTLSNNRDTSWRSETIVNVGSGNESPVTTMAPIINMQTGTSNATFQVPASDPDGDNLTYRLATFNEIRGGQPSGISINSSTGLITFNTQGRNVGSLWNAAIVVEDGKTKVINDFIIKIVQQSNPPVFDYAVTPSNGQIFQVSPGVPVNFSVKATDSDPGAIVSLQSIGVPPGATISLSNQNTSSITGNFSWTPTATNLGTNVINFLAQDNVGAQVSTSVTILVSLKPQFDIPPTPAQIIHNVYTPGDVISFTVQASDPDPLDVVSIVDVRGKDMMGQPTFLYNNASFNNLNAAPSNPTSGIFTWATQASDWGHKHVYFYAKDSYGDETRHEVSQLINTPPTFSSNPVLTADVGVAYSYTINVSDVDITYGDKITILGNSLPTWLTIVDNGNGTATLSGTPSVSDAGVNTVNIQAEDLLHHQDPRGTINQIFNLTVNNCTPVSFANINLYVQSSTEATSCQATVNYGLSVLGTTPTVTYTFTGATEGTGTGTGSGQTFNQGITHVTVSATNNCSTNSTSFDITVVDDVKPIAIAKPVTLYLDVNGKASLTAADVNNDSTDNCGIDTYTLDTSGTICATAAEGNNLTLTAPAGLVITSIDFASYGTPTGSCGNFALGSCHASNSLSIVSSRAIGQNSVTIPAVNSLFGDPCGGTVKRLYVQATYGVKSPSLVYDCNNLGTNSVNLIVTDTNGNASIATAIVTVVDKISPVITAPDNISVVATSADGAVVNYTTPVGTDNCAVTTVLTEGLANGATFPIGITTVTYTATDSSGNTAVASFNVEVVGVAPEIVVPTNISINSDAGICGAVVNFAATETTGIPASTITYDIQPGSLFSIGSTTITATATNAIGTSTKTFTVNVTDNEAPTVITKNITVELDANGNASITPEMINDGSTDACGIASYSLDNNTFTCENVGENQVILTVTDINGNAASLSATVTVKDVTAPTVITQNYSITLANGVANITPSDIDGGTFDNCTFSLSIDRDSFSCEDIGDHVVTLTAVDASGNTTSKSATVSVLGDVPTISINDFNAVQTQKKNTIFLGFGPQSVNLSTVVSGGSGFTYVWTTSSGEVVSNEANPSINPTVSTTYNVTVTNSNGCTASTSIYICVIDARDIDKKGRDTGKVIVCHHTNGKKGTQHVQISISPNAVMTHLTQHGVGTDHADSLGACNAVCVTNSNAKANTKEQATISSIEDNLSIYPNPSNGIFDVKLTTVNSQTELYLFDTTGKLLQHKSISKENSSENIITMGNYNLASGFYLLKIINENESVTKKLIIEKSK